MTARKPARVELNRRDLVRALIDSPRTALDKSAARRLGVQARYLARNARQSSRAGCESCGVAVKQHSSVGVSGRIDYCP